MKYLVTFLLTINIINASPTDTFYESDLSFSSPSFTVTFLHHKTVTPDNFTLFTHSYSSAIIFSKIKQIENHCFKSYTTNESTLYYYPLDNENNIPDLNSILEEQKTNFLTTTFMPSNEKSILKEISDLGNLTKDLKEADTVCITFGSGISAGYVPTLIEIFHTLELEKFCSLDGATDESMKNFIIRLINEKEYILDKTRSLWEKVRDCKVKTTPAHEGLADIIQQLKNENKKTYIYTDNIDGIHDKLNIKLSVSKDNDEGIRIVYPPFNDLLEKKVVVLTCGQSFDFNCVLSTIMTRGKDSKNLLIYTLNLSPFALEIYKDLDVENELNQKDGVDLADFLVESLNAKWIQGSLHD